MLPISRSTLCAAVVAAALLSAATSAETVNCTAITSLPAVIDTQGIFCLTGNLGTGAGRGRAIDIVANNVTLDLNGWKVGGQAAGAGTEAVGIYSTADNVSVKNGIVRGFNVGVYLLGRGAQVSDMLLDQNTGRGLIVTGLGARIEHNQVVDTGGTTLETDVVGIYVSGDDARVLNNDVAQTRRNSADGSVAYGIRVRGDGAVIERNRVSNSQDYGIYSSNNTDVSLVDNRIHNSQVDGVVGLRSNQPAASIYRDNIVTGFTTPYSAGIDGGGNLSD